MTVTVFLPGIIAPASVRYAPLLQHLAGSRAVLKDLEVYAEPTPPADYSIQTEIAGLDRAVEGLGPFHLYGHSGGGAVALAYAAVHGDRLLSLAVDEPAHDWTDAGNEAMGWSEFDAAAALPEPASTLAFLKLQLAPCVEPPSGPPGPPPHWMSKRPAGIAAFIRALRAHRIDEDAYRGFTKPVLFTRGTMSHPRWTRMQERLAPLFPDFTAEVFEGLHHLNTSHQAQPERVATLLADLRRRTEVS